MRKWGVYFFAIVLFFSLSQMKKSKWDALPLRGPTILKLAMVMLDLDTSQESAFFLHCIQFEHNKRDSCSEMPTEYIKKSLMQ